MHVTNTRLDLAAYQSGQDPPHEVIKRAPGELWLVSHDAVRMDQPIAWRHHTKKEHVYIPLVPYLTSTDPELAMAFMFQLGARVSFDLGSPVKRLHIVTGHPVHQVVQDGDNFWQIQVGFGLVLDN